MAAKVVLVAVAATLLAMLVLASGDNCPPVAQFAPCLQYVGSPSSPSPMKGGTCCQLVMKLSSDCLCNAAKNPIPGVAVNFQKALTLPKACGRPVPAHTTCNGTPVPGGR